MVVGSPKTGVSLGLPAKSIGAFPNETASIAYDGTLLPAGTAKYGSELVVNGGFDTDTAWTKGTEWAISGGVANVANVGVVTYLIPSPILSSIVGKTYLITFTVSNYVAGTVRFSYGGINGTAITANGTYTEIVTAISVNTFSLYAGTTASCSFDNVSVKEVLINPNYRYHKNLGVLKSEGDALSEAGQGKAFNGSNQHINTGIIPNPAQGTLVTRFTYASGAVSRWVYGSSEIGIWINASGKVECVFGNATYTITDTLVAGRSYHIEMPYLGLSANVILDGVTKGTATATVFNPTLPMYVGARNASGTADRFFNSVIDETYYYDIALTDAQISTLYQYPEKITTNTAGGIVPDIGNEANCKLFLPMSESFNGTTGNKVVNMAVPFGTEMCTNGGFDPDTIWTKQTGVTISGGTLNFNTASNNIQAYQNTNSNTGIPIVAGKAYLVTFTVSAYTSGSVNIGLGGSITTSNKSAIGTYSEVVIPTGTPLNIIYITSTYAGTGFVGSVDNVSVKEVSAFPIANFTASCVDSAKQLSYGAQCIAWKRDALGLPTGMSNGLSFDGGKSVKKLSSAFIPTASTDFVIEFVQYMSATAAKGRSGYYLNDTNTILVGNTSPNVISCRCDSTSFTDISLGGVSGYKHIALVKAGNIFSLYVNGVFKQSKALTLSNTTSPFYFGGTNLDNAICVHGTAKIHNGTQYTKFDIAKAYAKALKTIAKLGA